MAANFKAAAKANYGTLDQLVKAATSKIPTPAKPKAAGGAVGKAKAKALSGGLDGALRVKGREATAAQN